MVVLVMEIIGVVMVTIRVAIVVIEKKEDDEDDNNRVSYSNKYLLPTRL